MTENKSKIIEREYTIPLREKCRPVPQYKRTPKAVKTVKEFLARHMRVEDRDLNKVKLDKFLNEALWHRGIKNPIHKIKVKAVKEESGIVRAYGLDLPTGIEFKRIREEKKSAEQEKIGKEAAKEIEKKKKEEEAMKAPESEKSEDKNADGVNDKVEEKEKEKAVEEAGEKEAKAESKVQKHTTESKSPKEVKNSEKTFNKSSRGQ